MHCVLNGNSAKMLAKAVQSLSKFGAELFIEADENGLLLRSLNNSRSAIGSFKFNRHFFERYSIDSDTVNYCKITMKACFNAFRNMKQVEYCEIKLCVPELKFQMDIKCKHEQTKKIIISIIDEENITATVNMENAPNTITAPYKIFNEISSSFNALEEEITLDVDESALNIKNYVSGARVNDKFMRTQFKLAPSELDVYEISQTTSVTFCLKEFRAYLAFAEAINEDVTLQFGEAGNPLFMRIKKLDQLDCVLIMSTLSPEDVTFCDDIRQSELMNNTIMSVQLPQKRKSTLANSKAPNQPETKRFNGANATTLSNSSLFAFPESGDGERAATRNGNDNVENPPQIRPLPKHTTQPAVDPIPNDSILVEFYDTEKTPSEDEDCINQSQTVRPALRSIFSRCFQATYFPNEPSPSSQLFVPNSDSED